MANDKTVRNPIVTCDDCRKQFKLKINRIFKEKVIKNIERSYFVCPHCKRKYIIGYEDQEVKDNISKIHNIREQRNELTPDSEESNLLLEEHNKLHKRNIEISNKYKSIYGS